MAPPSDESPPDEAYGRVTNPERFAALHDEARRIVRDLEARFDVDIERGAHLDPELVAMFPDAPVEVVAVRPRSPVAAPLTFCLTAFPGLHVRVGRWHRQAFPTCGCDACDDQPDELIEKLRMWVEAVTRGDFAEANDGRRIAYQLAYPNGRRGGGEQLTNRDDPRRREVGVHNWEPWPPKPPAS